MIVLMDVAVRLTVSEVSSRQGWVSFSVEDSAGEMKALLHYDQDNVDPNLPVLHEIKFKPERFDVKNCKPGDTLLVSLNLMYQPGLNGSGLIVAREVNLAYLTERLEEEYIAATVNNSGSDDAPLTENILKEWINRLRDNDCHISCIEGAESCESFSVIKELHVETPGLIEYFFNSKDKADGFLIGLHRGCRAGQVKILDNDTTKAAFSTKPTQDNKFKI